MIMSLDDLSNIKLIGFLLSKSIAEKTGSTKDILGSLNWMSPEAYKNERKEPKSDIWSLGATMIEMVTIIMNKNNRKK